MSIPWPYGLLEHVDRAVADRHRRAPDVDAVERGARDRDAIERDAVDAVHLDPVLPADDGEFADRHPACADDDPAADDRPGPADEDLAARDHERALVDSGREVDGGRHLRVRDDAARRPP